MKKEITIKVSSGIDPKIAGELVNSTSAFKENVLITYDSVEVDLKSILGLMSLGIPSGKVVTVESENEELIEVVRKIIG